jgi:hypothetical protein
MISGGVKMRSLDSSRTTSQTSLDPTAEPEGAVPAGAAAPRPLLPKPPSVFETSPGRKKGLASRRPMLEPGGAVPAGARPRAPQVPGLVNGLRATEAGRYKGQFATTIPEIRSH